MSGINTMLNRRILNKLDMQDKMLQQIYETLVRPQVVSWEQVQSIIRMGFAPYVFVKGAQLLTAIDDTVHTLRVIGINHDVPADDAYTNSVTFQFDQCVGRMPFSAPQAMYHAKTPLSAGTHIFQQDTSNTLFQFTLTEGVPAGGTIFAYGWSGYNVTKVSTYGPDRVTPIEENVNVAIVGSGAPTLAVINDRVRCRYGSNNYVESELRDWLNSEDETYAWAAKTDYDRPNKLTYTESGFLKMLDPELLAVIGAVKKQVALNTVTDATPEKKQELFEDKIFLLSRVEVYGGPIGDVSGESVYAYFEQMAAAASASAILGRVKYYEDLARDWWLRSPHINSGGTVNFITTSGAVDNGTANSNNCVAPAFCIW